MPFLFLWRVLEYNKNVMYLKFNCYRYSDVRLYFENCINVDQMLSSIFSPDILVSEFNAGNRI